MNIMFEDSITDEVKQKYILLELDTFYFTNANKTSTAYCLVEHTPLQEMLTVEQFLDLHKNLIKNYRLKNWKYCEDAIEHLVGRWNKELDSFYIDISNRITQNKTQDLSNDWTGILIRD